METAWNNKCTHWLLNAARHILGNLEKRSSLPPTTPSTPPPTAVGFHEALGESTAALIVRGLLVLG